MEEANWSVGRVARRCGVNVSTLHFYEQKGLIRSWRSAGNQRRYKTDVLRRISVIKAAQKMGISLEEIKAMEAQRELVTLVCPGFFTDEGNWTGVAVADLLDLAGVKPEAEQIKFVAADGKYSANLKLEEVTGDGMLIAYAFEDKPLPQVHGYPLRVVAKDQPGNRWVKWLGEIVVR